MTVTKKIDYDSCSAKVAVLIGLLDDPNFETGNLHQILEIFGIECSDVNLEIAKRGLCSESTSALTDFVCLLVGVQTGKQWNNRPRPISQKKVRSCYILNSKFRASQKDILANLKILGTPKRVNEKCVQDFSNGGEKMNQILTESDREGLLDLSKPADDEANVGDLKLNGNENTFAVSETLPIEPENIEMLCDEKGKGNGRFDVSLKPNNSEALAISQGCDPLLLTRFTNDDLSALEALLLIGGVNDFKVNENGNENIFVVSETLPKEPENIVMFCDDKGKSRFDVSFKLNNSEASAVSQAGDPLLLTRLTNDDLSALEALLLLGNSGKVESIADISKISFTDVLSSTKLSSNEHNNPSNFEEKDEPLYLFSLSVPETRMSIKGTSNGLEQLPIAAKTISQESKNSTEALHVDKSGSNNSDQIRDGSGSTTNETINITELSFCVDYFKTLRENVKAAIHAKEAEQPFTSIFRIHMLDSAGDECNRKSSLTGWCDEPEAFFYLTKDDISACMRYKHQFVTKISEIEQNNDNQREPFIIALISILKIKYEEFNPFCTILNRLHNERKFGYTFYFYCLHPTCRVYKMKLDQVDGEHNRYKVEVYVQREKGRHLRHINDPIVGATKGVDRKETMEQLQHQTGQKVRTKLNRKLDSKLVKKGKISTKSKNVLKKIKSEGKVALNRSIDQWEDLIKFAKANKSYVKCVSRIPFNIISFTQEIFSLLREKNSFDKTFYLDGTGSIFRYDAASKRIQSYELLGKHVKTNTYLPIALLVTDSHDTLEFNKWLITVQSSFERQGYKKLSTFVREVVTDWSWALMIAVIRTFNQGQHSIQDYLKAAYEVKKNKVEDIDFTAIHICYCHWMKIVANNLNEVCGKKSVIKKKFMECMRVCVTFNSFELIDNWVRLITTIFCSQETTLELCEALDQMDEYYESIKELTAIKDDFIDFELEHPKDEDYKLIKEFDDYIKNEEEKARKKDEKNRRRLISQKVESTNTSVFSDSPFYERYSSIFCESLKAVTIEKSPENINNEGSIKPNPYFCPNFIVQKVIPKYMPLVPFWSDFIGVYIGNGIIKSNAPLEGHWRYSKIHIHGRLLYQRCSQGLRQRQTDIQGKVSFIKNIGAPDVYSNRRGKKTDNQEHVDDPPESFKSNKKTPKRNGKRSLKRRKGEIKRASSKLFKADDEDIIVEINPSDDDIDSDNNSKNSDTNSCDPLSIPDQIQSEKATDTWKPSNNDKIDTSKFQKGKKNVNFNAVKANDILLKKPAAKMEVVDCTKDAPTKKVLKLEPMKTYNLGKNDLIQKGLEWLTKNNISLFSHEKFILYNLRDPPLHINFFFGAIQSKKNKDNKVNIHTRTLWCLNPVTWVTGYFIDVMITIYLNKKSDNSIKQILCENSSELFKHINKLLERSRNQLAKHGKINEKNDYSDVRGKWIIPLNVDCSADSHPTITSANPNHWALLIADFNKKELLYLDPKFKANRHVRLNVIRDFLTNLKRISEVQNFNFDKRGWTIVDTSNLRYDLQPDLHNCGLYVCKYVECLLNDRDLFSLGTLDDERVYMRHLILKNITHMNCFYCGTLEENVLIKHSSCNTCGKFCCNICATESYYSIPKNMKCEMCTLLEINNIR